MMTEKELNALKEKRDEAKRFMDYCLDMAGTMQEGIYGALDYYGYYNLTTDELQNEDDVILDIIVNIYTELVKFKAQLEQRGGYWEKIYDVLADEVRDVEDELRREEEEEEEDIEFDEPDYGISRGKALWPEYAEWGTGA